MAMETKKKLKDALERAETMVAKAKDAEIRLDGLKKRAKVIDAQMTEALSGEDIKHYQELRVEFDAMPGAVRECLEAKAGDPAVMAELKNAWEAYKKEVNATRKETAAELKRLLKEYAKALLPDLNLLNEVNDFTLRIYPILQDETGSIEKGSEVDIRKSLLANVLKAEGYRYSQALMIYALICAGRTENLASLEEDEKHPEKTIHFPVDWGSLMGPVW